MAEETIEFNGAGFIPGVPGEYANCQVVFDEDTKEVLRVEPLGTPPPPPPKKPDEQASSTTTEASTDNQGG